MPNEHRQHQCRFLDAILIWPWVVTSATPSVQRSGNTRSTTAKSTSIGTCFDSLSFDLKQTMWGDGLSSRSEYFRRRGIEAQERPDHATKPEIKLALSDVASGWFLLAEQVTWLDKRNAAEHEDQKK